MLTGFGSDLPPGLALAWALRGPQGARIAARYLDRIPPTLALEEDEVLLWTGHLSPGADPSALADQGGLDAAERARATRFRHADDRDSYLAAHAALRLILAAATGQPPDALRFETGAHGKPALAPATPGAESFHVNLSHTRGAVAVAFARHPVGVDIEAARPLDDMREVAARVFAPEQIDALDAVPEAERTPLFYRFWTLGEALIKATGLGLSQDTRAFAFTARGAPELTRIEPRWGPDARWHFGALPAFPASVAGSATGKPRISG